jgi:hypothetical protein
MLLARSLAASLTYTTPAGWHQSKLNADDARFVVCFFDVSGFNASRRLQ